jgi:hypothetical protein
LKVPTQAVLPDGAFSIVARHTAGKPVTVTATPASVCRAVSQQIRPLTAGTCVVSATADGASVNRSVRIVKGTPRIGWSLKAETQNSYADRPHGIRTTSDGKWTARSTTANECAIKGTMIRAVALEDTSSLGVCRVQVEVPGTARWLPARVVLKTRIVESVLSFSVAVAPVPIKPDVAVVVTVRLTYPDRSLDGHYELYPMGCGSSNWDRQIDGRTNTFTFTPSTSELKNDVDSTGHCTLTVHAGIGGTLHIIGQHNVEKSLAVSL